MEGVTILAQETICKFHGASFLFILFLCTLIGFDLNYFSDEPFSNKQMRRFLVWVVLGLAIGIVVGIFANKPHEQYKISISENVSFVEFYEKYEIVDQEGSIFTVREKDQN